MGLKEDAKKKGTKSAREMSSCGRQEH